MSDLNVDPGSVVIFRNDKGGVEKRPDYRGELRTPDGQAMEIALWVSESARGMKYFSGKVQPPRDQNGNPGQTSTDDAREAAAQAHTPVETVPEDDVPF